MFGGGVALNCVANGKIHDLKLFKNIYIQPASGDAGGSLGSALAVNHIYFGQNRLYSDTNFDLMKGSYLGPEYSNKEIMIMNKKYKAVFKRFNNFKELSEKIALLISKEKVIGWFQGKSEFGPRALGNRSILGDPRSYDMQKKLNLKIKNSEGFRPFAPSVLEEDYSKFFEGKIRSPYMLMVKKIQEKLRHTLPSNYSKLNFWDKLYLKRSKLQSITHVDFSARVQTVSKESNPKYWSLINEFKKITKIGVLINTSFNVSDFIVETPEDAFKCFMNTEMDYLVINNYFYSKESQIIKLKKKFLPRLMKKYIYIILINIIILHLIKSWI